MTPREAERIAYLKVHRGPSDARAWALDAARGYRRAVLRHTHPLYRRQQIEAYLSLKRVGLGS